MNRQFYELYSNFYTTVAQAQQQLEHMAAGMKQGFAGASDLSELFQHLNHSLKEQSDQFHALMERIHCAYNDKP